MRIVDLDSMYLIIVENVPIDVSNIVREVLNVPMIVSYYRDMLIILVLDHSCSVEELERKLRDIFI